LHRREGDHVNSPQEHPLLMSGPLVVATLRDVEPKTQTRRLTREGWLEGWFRCLDPEDPADMPNILAQCPYGVVGDRLWLRERQRVAAVERRGKDTWIHVVYEADGARSDWLPYPDRLAAPVIGKCLAYGGPRETSRIDLEITAVRVERLQAITEEDARAEGVTLEPCTHPDCGSGQGRCAADSYRATFAVLWDRINGKRSSWASDPWVWAITFRRIRP
jgi:hypothetical protein